MNAGESNAVLIGIDWGTSSLRAYLIDSHGVVLDTLQSPEGIMHVPGKDFEKVLVSLIEPWRSVSDLPLIASGMITSRNGWFETPYLPLPANAQQLAYALESQRTSTGLKVHFVTGVTTSLQGAPDVIRGEETQIVGAVEAGLSEGVVVMPGTHSKWVRVSDERIDHFSTFMSGEIFAALREHTILGTLMKDSGFQIDGFKKGVAAGFNAGTKLLHTLFHVRTLPLFDLIIGKDSLAERYTCALESLNIKVTIIGNDIVSKGHFRIAKSAGLI